MRFVEMVLRVLDQLLGTVARSLVIAVVELRIAPRFLIASRNGEPATAVDDLMLNLGSQLRERIGPFD
jgi:hypothetical protein